MYTAIYCTSSGSVDSRMSTTSSQPPVAVQSLHIPLAATRDAFDVLRQSGGRPPVAKTTAPSRGQSAPVEASSVRFRAIREDILDASENQEEEKSEESEESEVGEESAGSETAEENTSTSGVLLEASASPTGREPCKDAQGPRGKTPVSGSTTQQGLSSMQNLFFPSNSSLEAPSRVSGIQSQAGSFSVASRKRKKAHQRIFRVPGITCVGCNLAPEDIRPVVDFVVGCCVRMEKTALYKAAARVYIDQVVTPRQNEGVGNSPSWSWVQIHKHFEEHVLHERLMAADAVTGMRAARRWCEQRLVRETDAAPADANSVLDESEPVLELDRKHADMYAKLLPLEAAATAKLFASTATARGVSTN